MPCMFSPTLTSFDLLVLGPFPYMLTLNPYPSCPRNNREDDVRDMSMVVKVVEEKAIQG